MDQIRLELEQFRAINKADIVLNGMTVVAGENGSGKSTLSQFLYYVFAISNDYDQLVDNNLKEELERYLRYSITIVEKELNSPVLVNWNTDIFKEVTWCAVIDKFISDYEVIDDKKKASIVRLELILKDILNLDTTTELNLQQLLLELKKKIQQLFAVASLNKKNRYFSFVKKKLSSYFSNELPRKYAITEYGSVIVSCFEATFTKPHSIQRTAYIDTPMLLGMTDTSIERWTQSNDILFGREVEDKITNNIQQIISEEIIKGDTSVDVENYIEKNGTVHLFTYKRDDGSEFNLLECATGVKSFAMLQLLLKNGFLNKYTLLIIDEPESHLHPQWIIEYARLIVLLNKYIGVKFFIASHNPDMVSAIKYISEKEGIDNKLNFYLAERESESSYKYNYVPLGTDIEPIFESFNIALERINRYGTKEEDEA